MFVPMQKDEMGGKMSITREVLLVWWIAVVCSSGD
jgi:hypothetical protein